MTWDRSSAAIPIPVSATTICAPPYLFQPDGYRYLAAFRREFHRVRQQVQYHLAQPQGVGHQAQGFSAG